MGWERGATRAQSSGWRVVSGVRSSSGAASLGASPRDGQTKAAELLALTAPEDGHTPVKRHWDRGPSLLRVLLLCLLFACGCQKQHGTVLGKAPTGQVRTILAVNAGDTPRQVTLSGQMIEKCPVAGCWFKLRDETGTIKVDTRSAGFVVVKVPLDSKVVVSGKIVTGGDDVSIEATGIRY